MVKLYINRCDKFGDPVVMTYKEFLDLADIYPDWHLDKSKFYICTDDQIYYEFEDGWQLVGEEL